MPPCGAREAVKKQESFVVNTSERRLKTICMALAATMLAGQVLAQTKPSLTERFNSIWSPTSNPDSGGEPTDGTFKVDGNYCVPYGGAQPVCLELGNAAITPAAKGNGTITLTVPAGKYQGAEIMTNAGWTPTQGSPPPFGPSSYGYGYYETRMKPSCVQGEISSFFWVEAPGYGPHEWDVEFPNPPGHTFSDVHFTLHPSNSTVDYHLGFNPCLGYHSYGFLWTPGHITFTVDRVGVQTFNESDLVTTATGFIMANAWTGNPNWGGGPAKSDAVNSYKWIGYLAGATTIPTW
jgi:hypothetical protein